jgi:GNAT superfamily N-acetyltransferase
MVSEKLVKITGTSREQKLRLLDPSDIPAAMALSSSAGWNQTSADWQMLLSLDRDGCFAIEVESELAATTTLLRYGGRLAWIGMVLTKTEHRRLGMARRLLTMALNRADELGIQTVKLDATEQGQPLYESLGFRAEQTVERWSRSGLSHTKPKPTNHLSPEGLAQSDLEAFGADRSRLLHLLGKDNPPLKINDAYLFSRPGRLCAYIGPCVSSSRKSAFALIEKCASAIPANAWFWDLLPSNCDARSIALDLGFTLQRRLLRMARGKDLRGKDDSIYAIAGFEFG